MMKTCYCFLLCFVCYLHSSAQDRQQGYPQNYFRNPLGIPIRLAGNFGECRPGHFHSGLDIKTEGKENYPVYAAADGYISRIKMEKGGFGHALYLTHPNGYTTLYAHLNDFMPEIQEYTTRRQYEQESWAVDLTVKAEKLPVKKGQQIAWSGNTGGSSAPHLHFEIRDSRTEHPLNPQLFGFEISDSTAPLPLELAFYDLNHSVYHQEPKVLKLAREGGVFTLRDTVLLETDRTGMSIHVNDFMEGSRNTLNFYKAHWYIDDRLLGSILLDDIGYDVTRYLHAYADYSMYKRSGDWFQNLFRLPGNLLEHIYRQTGKAEGAILWTDTQVHRLRIVLEDAYQNSAEISFLARGGSTVRQEDSCRQLFKVNRPAVYEHPSLRFRLDEMTLYDDLCFSLLQSPDSTAFSGRFRISDPSVPVHRSFDLYIKPHGPLPFALREKIALVYEDGKTETGKAAVFKDGFYKASVRSFGTYFLVADTTAPVITALNKQDADLGKAKRLSFRVKEERSSVKTFRAELDGKWLCFEPRGEVFFYTFDERCAKSPPGAAKKHRLVVHVTDENGNGSSLVYNFKR